MATTPLFKSLKSNGTSFYAFPGAAEDISAAYQNSNYKMYFSKYALVNLPKKINSSTQSSAVWDFSNTFKKSINSVDAANFSDSMIESLRNYVANQETVIRETRLNNNQYYYDTNALSTTTEKIFLKWCKNLGAIDFEPAIPEDEYFSNLGSFQRNDPNDDSYFPEYLWKEREVIQWDSINFYQTAISPYDQSNRLEIEFNGETNFRVGDHIRLFNVSNSLIYGQLGADNLNDSRTEEGMKINILHIEPSTPTQGQRIVVDIRSNLGLNEEFDGQCELIYNRLFQYIGEVNGISNVQEANRSYTEVYAHIPDHTGMTPDILFRTSYDINYSPNLTFPILPSQIQPEILGSELFNSPIVSSPQNYPGSYFGQFDTLDFTYTTSTGDYLRRSGDYFGVSGDINNITVNPSTLDGLGLDFNNNHYVKMNIVNRVSTNFDQFNALEVNNTPPNDFEFNAILWYYTVEDDNGSSATNLYGISFLDNPDNNVSTSDIGLKFPTYKKLVSNGNQDGSSFAFSLNLNFNIINENFQESYNPEAINSMFSMNLFNSAMQKLSSTNDSFLNILASQNEIKSDLNSLKGLIYSQTDISTINTKIKSLENLLRLYSTNQLISSSSVKVTQIQTSPPTIQLDNIDTSYYKVDNLKTTDLYNAQGILPINLSVPENKNWLVYILNNDEVSIPIPNNDRLTISLDSDLAFKQSVEFYISSSEFSTQNKKIDIYINSDLNISSPTEVLIVGDIDLPVYYNEITNAPNSSSTWSNFNFNIDFDKDIYLKVGSLVELSLKENKFIVNNSINPGDSLVLNNFFLGTSSVYNFSGQYLVDSVDPTNSKIKIDCSNNTSLKSFTSSQNQSSNLPLLIHSSTSSSLSNTPYISLNKGKKITVTRISNLSNNLSERYRVDINNL